ncbi:hypothetical protein AXG93_2471s1170 [Marchantia polymorpha subsp. ruderalis]|uniref:Uncharacterized protein n=1 Tax=Marchantia polymorpha subsp. ruderalis TaxID=1480154 RepID=A0A176W141_MARPO|nr:hypothetical protein AXG93_2471s1170 [Marchantia polymorpha subsp. ruderalis]
MVRNRTRIKVATNPALISWGTRCRELELKNDVLHQHLAITRRLHQAMQQQRDAAAVRAKEDFERRRAMVVVELQEERSQNRILTEELAQQTRALEQCQSARKADEELLRNLQSQCAKLRAQRAEAEVQLAKVEGSSRRDADRTREELVARVNHCLKG